MAAVFAAWIQMKSLIAGRVARCTCGSTAPPCSSDPEVRAAAASGALWACAKPISDSCMPVYRGPPYPPRPSGSRSGELGPHKLVVVLRKVTTTLILLTRTTHPSPTITHLSADPDRVSPTIVPPIEVSNRNQRFSLGFASKRRH